MWVCKRHDVLGLPFPLPWRFRAAGWQPKLDEDVALHADHHPTVPEVQCADGPRMDAASQGPRFSPRIDRLFLSSNATFQPWFTLILAPDLAPEMAQVAGVQGFFLVSMRYVGRPGGTRTLQLQRRVTGGRAATPHSEPSGQHRGVLRVGQTRRDGGAVGSGISRAGRHG